MKLTYRLQNGIYIFDLEGNIISDNVDITRSYILLLLEGKTFSGILLNLHHVKMIDSSGVGLITSLFKGHPNKFALCHLTLDHQTLFQMTNLDKVIPIFLSEKGALGSTLWRVGESNV